MTNERTCPSCFKYQIGTKWPTCERDDCFGRQTFWPMRRPDPKIVGIIERLEEIPGVDREIDGDIAEVLGIAATANCGS